MRERNKNKKGSKTDFISYYNDKMRSEERNAFEKELQKDPFAEEASEGFALITPEEVSGDIADLQKHLKNRVGNRGRIIYYRIAAAIAALMIVSSILVIIERNRLPKEIAIVTDHHESLEITQSLPITVESDKEEFSEQPPAGLEKKSGLPANRQSKKQSELSEKEVISDDYKNFDTTTKIEIIPANEPSRSERAVAQPQASIKEERSSLDEAVVTGYGISKSESDTDNLPAGHLPPQPAAGKSEFDKYIRANLVRPDTLLSGQKAVVVLNFIVHTDGSIDSIKIIKSPGKQFSEEAVRLLRSGPAWRPAEADGKPVEDEVRLRIVFR